MTFKHLRESRRKLLKWKVTLIFQNTTILFVTLQIWFSHRNFYFRFEKSTTTAITSLKWYSNSFLKSCQTRLSVSLCPSLNIQISRSQKMGRNTRCSLLSLSTCWSWWTRVLASSAHRLTVSKTCTRSTRTDTTAKNLFSQYGGGNEITSTKVRSTNKNYWVKSLILPKNT